MARTTSPKFRPLSALSLAERSQILDELIRNRPELATEVDRLAAQLLHAHEDREAVALRVAAALQALDLGDLADRAGAQWGGGYVEPTQAAHDLLTETLQPVFDDLTRRAKLGATAAATETGYGTLLGLSMCRTCRNDDLVLSHAGLPDAVDELAWLVVDTMARAGLTVDAGWMAEECPEWLALVQRR